MTAQQPPPAAYAFGPFVVDPCAEELKKHGVRLRLPRQSFQVLLMLVERPSQLVPREELQRALWPSDTFVDFEKGLNAAVNRLRETLADSADNPRYVETLPRRGYRFIAPVERRAAQAVLPDSPLRDSAPSLTRPGKPAALLVPLFSLLALAAILAWVKPFSVRALPHVVDSVQITKDGLPKATYMLASDGTRLYFQEGLRNAESRIPVLGMGELKTTLMEVSARGGEPARIPISLTNPIAFDFSKSQAELLLGGGGRNPGEEAPLWALPLPAGAPHRLGEIVARDASWAPDGRSMAFTRDNAAFLAKADGSDVRKLASGNGFEYAGWIRFAPDGKRLRFTATKSITDPPEIMEIAADGSGLHPLAIPGACCGAWSVDGKYYFYVKDDNVWVLPERHSLFGKIQLGAPVQLTAGPVAYRSPTPSGDPKELYVVGEQDRVALTRYEAGPKRWVPYLGGLSAGELEVSRDGQWVTYTTFPDANLWRSRSDGSDRLQLTFPPINAHEPRWSPDGKQILFTDFPDKMFVVSANGGPARQLLPTGNPDFIGAGAWLPDGHDIIFGRRGCGTGDCWGIFRMDLQTQRVEKIPGSDRMLSTRLSPDGHYLTANLYNENKVMLYDLRTQRWSKLADTYGSVAWSHNSRSVFMILKHESTPDELVRISVPDGKVHRLLDLNGVATGGFWADWVSLLPDDSPVLMFDRSIEEIYRLDLRYQ